MSINHKVDEIMRENFIMATVHFKKELSNIALQLIEAKGSVDKVKAYYDIQQIRSFFSAYDNNPWYDTASAKALDKRLREDYPVIDSIDALPASAIGKRSGSGSLQMDPIVNRLLQDYWGIQIDVLLKDGIVKEIKDFVRCVEAN